MTSNLQRQRTLHVSQQTRKSIGWGSVIGIALLRIFLSASVQAAVFTVNSPEDAVDGGGIANSTLRNYLTALPRSVDGGVSITSEV